MNTRKEYFAEIKDEVKSRYFYRDLCTEVIGTFILVTVQIFLVLDPNKNLCPSVVNGTCSAPDPGIKNMSGDIIRITLGMGFVVVLLADGFGSLGGAHFNPAVTVAFTIHRNITFFKALFYIISQVIGSTLAACFVFGVTPYRNLINPEQNGGFALTMLAPGISPVRGCVVEGFATAVLVFTVLGTTNSRRRDVYIPAVPIGFAVACCLFTAIPYTGCGINPARSLGPAIIAFKWMGQASFKDHWVYWVGPILGSIAASLIYMGLNQVDVEYVEINRQDEDKYKDDLTELKEICRQAEIQG